MKNNKGVTLTSLIIYVIGMVIVVASISTLTTFFYKNIDTSAINDNTTTQYTKFLSYFTEEINNSNNKVVECKNNYIIFSSGNQYTYMEENKSIYKNKIKLCDNVEKCEFSYKYQAFHISFHNITFLFSFHIKYISDKISCIFRISC